MGGQLQSHGIQPVDSRWLWLLHCARWVVTSAAYTSSCPTHGKQHQGRTGISCGCCQQIAAGDWEDCLGLQLIQQHHLWTWADALIPSGNLLAASTVDASTASSMQVGSWRKLWGCAESEGQFRWEGGEGGGREKQPCSSPEISSYLSF